MNQTDGMKTILLVEKMEPFKLLAQGELDLPAERFNLVTASNGKEAVEFMSSTKVDVLVTGLQMPQMDGFGLMAHMSKNAMHIPVIVWTAFGSPEIEKRLRQGYNFRILMQKPSDIDAMRHMIIEAASEDAAGRSSIIELAPYLQLVELTKKTCTLRVRSEEREGVLYFNKGKLVDAETNGITGEGAANEIFAWKACGIDIEDGCGSRDCKISTPLLSLLQGTGVPGDAGGKSGLSHEALLEKAIDLANGHHFPEAGEILAELSKLNQSDHRVWLWYSRCTQHIEQIQEFLEKAREISPDNPEVVAETEKINLAEKLVGNERFRRCPFCWTPITVQTHQCQYCHSHLFIHNRLSPSLKAERPDIMQEALERYLKVVDREKNINARYFLSLAYLHQGQWDKARSQLKKTVELAPKVQFLADQLQILEKLNAAKKAATGQKSAAASPPGGNGKKILVVEDSLTTRKVIVKTLTKKGYEISEAADGLDALSKLDQTKPDLILLDIILPRMDGYQVLSIIKKTGTFKDIPVVMLTSKDGMINKFKGKRAGSTAYLTKPFKPSVLLKTIEEHLGSSE